MSTAVESVDAFEIIVPYFCFNYMSKLQFLHLSVIRYFFKGLGTTAEYHLSRLMVTRKCTNNEKTDNPTYILIAAQKSQFTLLCFKQKLCSF